MRKVVIVEYDASENVLRLVEPLEGVRDHQKMQAVVTEVEDAERPWMELSGSLSKEAGEEMSRILNELFPPWDK